MAQHCQKRTGKDDEEGLGGDAHLLLALRGQLDVQKDDREAQDGKHDLEGIDDYTGGREPQVNKVAGLID